MVHPGIVPVARDDAGRSPAVLAVYVAADERPGVGDSGSDLPIDVMT
jgi:hypothetical protein